MNKLYMGIDTGNDNVKGIIIDEYDNIMAKAYFPTEGDPSRATKRVINEMKDSIDLNKYQVVSWGVTGSARKLVGAMLDASVVKNEILSLAIGTYRLFPAARTIIEIGSYDSKVVFLNQGVICDYEISHMCAMATGTFISNMARKMNYSLNDLDSLSDAPSINSKCAVFAESELLRKINQGYTKKEILASVCKTMVDNYLNNVLKDKKIMAPVVFTGGVSGNEAIVNYFSSRLGCNIQTLKNSLYVSALGIAVIARECKEEKNFCFDVDNINIETRLLKCNKCNACCEIVAVYKNNELIDYWGNNCGKNNHIHKNLKFV